MSKVFTRKPPVTKANDTVNEATATLAASVFLLSFPPVSSVFLCAAIEKGTGLKGQRVE